MSSSFGSQWIESTRFWTRIRHLSYHLVWRAWVGDKLDEMLVSPEYTEQSLHNQAIRVRYVALAVLQCHWAASEDTLSVIEWLALNDPSPKIRVSAVGLLGSCYRRTDDDRIYRLLMTVADDPKSDHELQNTAKFSMLQIFRADVEKSKAASMQQLRENEARNRASKENLLLTGDPPDDDFNVSGFIDWQSAQESWEAFAAGVRGFENSQYGAAIDCLTKAVGGPVKSIPWEGVAHLFRGCAHGNLGELDAAIADFTVAIDRDPAEPEAYRERGEAYLKKGLLDRSEADRMDAESRELQIANSRRRFR